MTSSPNTSIIALRKCLDCKAPLNAEEIKYYADTCEKCEQAFCDRVEKWRHGGDDAELDEMYGDRT